jgi:regulator of protease activity HflC (stomatin/prohibitin superfamily)
MSTVEPAYKVRMFDRIKNLQRAALPADLRLNPLALLALTAVLAAGVGVELARGAAPRAVVEIAAAAVLCAGLLLSLPSWGLLIALLAVFWIGGFARYGQGHLPARLAVTAGLLLASGLQVAHHWEKAVILRLGRFHRLRGPGLFWLLPVLDRVTRFVDTRIRVTDFSAEKTITMDTVPVHVDALAFWMIWDAQKAVLEVENFLEAVVLSAQTALRDSIGKHELADLLSERERLGREIQQSLDRKTNPWGISILSIEITDIIIPKELEDAMSKRAQAERERQSRVILGEAEREVAAKFVEAARAYATSPTALQLRGMNMIYEGIRQHGTIVLLPSGALSAMSLSGALEDLAQGRLPGGPPREKSGPAGAEGQGESR